MAAAHKYASVKLVIPCQAFTQKHCEQETQEFEADMTTVRNPAGEYLEGSPEDHVLGEPWEVAHVAEKGKPSLISGPHAVEVKHLADDARIVPVQDGYRGLFRLDPH